MMSQCANIQKEKNCQNKQKHPSKIEQITLTYLCMCCRISFHAFINTRTHIRFIYVKHKFLYIALFCVVCARERFDAASGYPATERVHLLWYLWKSIGWWCEETNFSRHSTWTMLLTILRIIQIILLNITGEISLKAWKHVEIKSPQLVAAPKN